jgi:dolichol-phosphate mannosyltransferase
MPITWRNRRTGQAKLKIKEMGSRYFFIVAYVWLEKYFSRGDYRKQAAIREPIASAGDSSADVH